MRVEIFRRRINLISVILDEESSITHHTDARAPLILAEGSLTVGLSTLEQLLLASLDVVILATPCTEDGSLEGATKAEGKGPGLLGSCAPVDCPSARKPPLQTGHQTGR